MSKYYMCLKGMYVMTLQMSSKERISMDNEMSCTEIRSIKIKLIEVVSGRNEAIEFDEFDNLDKSVIEELQRLGYEKEKVEDSSRYFLNRHGNIDFHHAHDKYGGLLDEK